MLARSQLKNDTSTRRFFQQIVIGFIHCVYIWGESDEQASEFKSIFVKCIYFQTTLFFLFKKTYSLL